ncbi:hypothetical protein F5B22DRAFT_261122 [Xylaria bambusicola]|uniref:uncharacterized protein n=1 Tax=Xylaria bambusicola TaxID=326684 RepID=UPI0020087732|nr:uncharacterized protein F5B22DRAFT_261122 [Xylaria bambusicola]KAI0525938.1 hypothetical protein F5B22DRAFT_261122 [Xylaria bambusicola]
MGAQQPYMYDSGRRDSRLPEKEFDPKAVTRASWQEKPKKAKKEGPLVSFGRHPDAHAVPTGRTYNFQPMSDTAKWWIRWTRYFQLFLRALELIAGAGLLTLMILITDVMPLVAWILRIAPGVIVLCCAYAILHLAKPARARPPASSAAYQVFAATTDLAISAFYAFGAITVPKESGSWDTLLADKDLLPIFIKSENYTLLAGIGLHAVSLGISIYLAVMFRRIANMPPDMNPLESNLTSRTKHKRNKSSVASSYTSMSESSKRLSTPLEDHRRSGAPYEDLSRPPSIPFMNTRTGSRDSFSSSKRDSRVDLPSRQYQITPGNSPRNSPRNSTISVADQRRQSNTRLAQRGNYMEIPLHETGTPSSSRPGSSMNSQPINASPTRVARFTEAWYASESLVNRTQQRQRAMNAGERTAAERSKAYEALNQRYTGDNESDSEQENVMGPEYISDSEDDDGPINITGNMHPNPLRLNPHRKGPIELHDSPTAQPVLTEMSSNRRSVSGSQDIVDAQSGPVPARRPTIWNRIRGNRNSSIQADNQFYSKPYGELKSATPPIPYGGDTYNGDNNRPIGVEGRQISSGNDYDLSSASNLGYRRKVSGIAAEEGRAGPTSRYSRYSALNE